MSFRLVDLPINSIVPNLEQLCVICRDVTDCNVLLKFPTSHVCCDCYLEEKRIKKQNQFHTCQKCGSKSGNFYKSLLDDQICCVACVK